MTIRFSEEVLLSLLSEETGYFLPIPEWKMSCVLAGSVLIDLSLEDRIDSDLERLMLVDPAPTGDEMLDPVLEEIAQDTETRSPQYWVERIARRSDEIGNAALERLVEAGILQTDAGGFWSVSSRVARSKRYPTADGESRVEIKTRIMRTLFDGEIPGPRDIAVIGLLNACGGIHTMLEPEEYESAKERIELIGGMDLIGRTIADAVRSSYRPPASMRSVRRRSIPALGLYGLLSSRTFRSGNIPKFMAEKAKELGPVFRMNAGGREFTVLAGVEMNRWVGRKGRLFLRTRDYLEDFQREWGTARSIASMDGGDHFRMRKAVRAGNGRAVVEDRLDEVLALGRRSFAGWGLGSRITAEDACQRMVAEQTARLSVSFDPGDILDDLLRFEYRALLVHVHRILPEFTLRTPAMKRAKAGVLELYAQIHATHTPAQREGKRRDLVDDLMDLHQSDPQFLPETDLGFAFIAPIIAGHYTASALGFAIYEMLANPGLHDRIAAEADALFENGDPVCRGPGSGGDRRNPPFRHGGVEALSGDPGPFADRDERVRGRGLRSAGVQQGSRRLSRRPFRRGLLQGPRPFRYRPLRASQGRAPADRRVRALRHRDAYVRRRPVDGVAAGGQPAAHRPPPGAGNGSGKLQAEDQSAAENEPAQKFQIPGEAISPPRLRGKRQVPGLDPLLSGLDLASRTHGPGSTGFRRVRWNRGSDRPPGVPRPE